MVTAEEITQMQAQDSNIICARMATVVSLFSAGTAKIQFYGEETASEKEYSYLSSYIPKVDDVVIMLPLLDTYVIAGSVLYKVGNSSNSNFITNTDLNAALANYAPSAHYHDRLHHSANPNNAYVYLNAYTGGTAWTFRASSSGTTDLGTSGTKFKDIYATNGTIQTSDAREKELVSLVKEDKRYTQLFWMLIPKAYTMTAGASGRTHLGFYSQDIEKAMETCGLDSTEFAGFIKSPIYKLDDDGIETDEIIDFAYGLRYEEFHAIEVAVMQDMNERLLRLEGRYEE